MKCLCPQQKTKRKINQSLESCFMFRGSSQRRSYNGETQERVRTKKIEETQR